MLLLLVLTPTLSKINLRPLQSLETWTKFLKTKLKSNKLFWWNYMRSLKTQKPKHAYAGSKMAMASKSSIWTSSVTKFCLNITNTASSLPLSDNWTCMISRSKEVQWTAAYLDTLSSSKVKSKFSHKSKERQIWNTKEMLINDNTDSC